MNNKLRIISFLLAIVMLVGTLPVLAIDQETEFTNSADVIYPSSGLYPGNPYYEEGKYYAFMNPKLSAEERAADLVSRMTPEEKYSQLRARTAAAIPRLGIQEYNWWREALHGVARDGTATSFPTGLGIASTWDVDLVQQMGAVVSDEAREKFNVPGVTNGLNYWSPTVNMARDPLWGRADETYGEDPFLAGMIGVAYIDGMQGANEDNNGYFKTIATPKHFLGNNSDSNRHNGSSNITERDLREYYTPAFKACVEDGNAGAIMTSYNAVNGVPVSVNTPILEDIVRRTWGFDGFFVTDCDTLTDVFNYHKWRPEGWDPSDAWTGVEAAAYAMMAGVDLNCGDTMPDKAGTAIAQGLISEDLVDIALVRLFTARMKTGEFDFDCPYAGPAYQSGQVHAADHQQLAERSSDNAVVLLKNDNGTLPLGKDPNAPIEKFVLVGDYADYLELGNYSTREPQHDSTALKGIKEAYERYCERNNIEGSFRYIKGTVDTGTSTSGYLMNIMPLELYDNDGNLLRTLDWNKCVERANCEIATTGNVGNMSNSTGAWLRFDEIDFTNVATIKIKAAGNNATPTTVTITGEGTDLAKFSIKKGNTNGWQKYDTYEFQYEGAGQGFGRVMKNVCISFTKYEIAESGFSEDERNAIKDANAVVFFAGTKQKDNGFFENRDGYTLDLPNGQNELINEVAELNNNVTVYMQTGSQSNVEPFKEKVEAMLWSAYNGQAQGNAAGRLLFGEANPSAKLPITWYTDVKQLADIKDYTLRPDKETENLGRTYQYFTGKVTYPFGYGLSYTTFEYSNLNIDKDSVTPDDTITVTVDVTNTGDVAGQEVVQLYVVSPDAEANGRPAKRLECFDKIALAPGEKQTVTLTLDVEDLWYWDAESDIQTYDQGTYTIQVGADSEACEQLTKGFNLSGQLTKVLNVATAIPSGHILDMEQAGAHIETELSACYNDQSFVNLDAADVMVRYTSTDPMVAAVDEHGTVTAVNAGITTITASVTVNGVEKTSSYPVVVQQAVRADNILVDGKGITGFDPETFTYSVAAGDSVPEVSVDVSDAFRVEITQPTAENRTATVKVIGAEDTVTYTIVFIDAPQSADFTRMTETELLQSWEIENQDADKWSIDKDGLHITTQQGDIYKNKTGAHNIFTQNADGDWTAETKVTFDQEPFAGSQQVAFMAYQDQDNYVKISYEMATPDPWVQMMSESNRSVNTSSAIRQTLKTNIIYLRMEKKGNAYTASYSTDGSDWKVLGTKSATLQNPKIALMAINGNSTTDEWNTTFEYVNIMTAEQCTCDLYHLEFNGGTVVLPSAYELNAQASVRGGCVMDGHAEAPVTYTYSIKEGAVNTAGATVEGNRLNAKTAGEVEVTVTASLYDAKPVTATATFVVTEDGGVVPVESVALNRQKLTLTENGSEQLIATVQPYNATNQNVTWTTSDNMVATVVEGKVTAVAEGTATITATTKDGGKTATCVVTVEKKDDGGSTGGGSSTTSRYTITVTQATGGKITPSTTSVTKGSDKTFTITANEGYKIADVLVDGKSVGAVSTYTFKNVTVKHTITAKFEKDEAGTIDRFIDVKTGDWFYDAVEYVVENGLMNGVAPDQFAPQKETTRGMIVTILYREAGSPKVESDGKTWWSDARVWAMEEGISDGTNMDGTITREQLAAMLYRYAGSPAVDGELKGFADTAKVSDWAKDAMMWAVENGIIEGMNGSLNPQGKATRAQVATMLMRSCEVNK